eukprot:Nk52_evm48s62 gene=Nk52_evmTU48s62
MPTRKTSITPGTPLRRSARLTPSLAGSYTSSIASSRGSTPALNHDHDYLSTPKTVKVGRGRRTSSIEPSLFEEKDPFGSPRGSPYSGSGKAPGSAKKPSPVVGKQYPSVTYMYVGLDSEEEEEEEEVVRKQESFYQNLPGEKRLAEKRNQSGFADASVSSPRSFPMRVILGIFQIPLFFIRMAIALVLGIFDRLSKINLFMDTLLLVSVSNGVRTIVRIPYQVVSSAFRFVVMLVSDLIFRVRLFTRKFALLHRKLTIFIVVFALLGGVAFFRPDIVSRVPVAFNESQDRFNEWASNVNISSGSFNPSSIQNVIQGLVSDDAKKNSKEINLLKAQLEEINKKLMESMSMKSSIAGNQQKIEGVNQHFLEIERAVEQTKRDFSVFQDSVKERISAQRVSSGSSSVDASEVDRLDSAIDAMGTKIESIIGRATKQEGQTEIMFQKMDKFIEKGMFEDKLEEMIGEQVNLALHEMLDLVENPMAENVEDVDENTKLLSKRITKIFVYKAHMKRELKALLEEQKESIDERPKPNVVDERAVESIVSRSIDSHPALSKYRNGVIPSFDEITAKVLAFVRADASKATRDNSLTPNDISQEAIRRVLSEELEKRDADKIGIADYALASAGARVVMDLTSDSFGSKSAWTSLLGIPIGKIAMHPSVSLSPDNSVGNCWAFHGSEGHLVIELSEPILPSMFSLEHANKLVARNMSSAVKDFEVYGFELKHDEPILFGTYAYDIEGSTIQSFLVQNNVEKPVRFVKLNILNNHGNENFTCVYRFRVHKDTGNN